MIKKKSLLAISFLIFCLSCTREDSTIKDLEVDPENTIPETNEITNHLFLVNDAGSNRVFLINKDKENVFEWQLDSGIGNDCVLMENGKLLALLQADNPLIEFGGYGGKLQIINPDFTVEWEYIISDENQIAHHDIEMLPNGNILALIWRKKSSEEAQNAGFKENHAIYPESIVEINPGTSEIVWEWNSWDHMIQDYDSTAENFGDISSNPSKIDINYSLVPNGDIMHANGLDYDPEQELIYLSVNFFSEVWVIDHSTTTEIARLDTGGRHNKGGDLVYRFGNPEAYQNEEGKRLFYNNHYPNLIMENGRKKMLIFMNGSNTEQSSVYEFDLANLPEMKANTDNEPELLWEFTKVNLFSSKVSGAELLSNGNILITIGVTGIWEVDRQGNILWKYETEGFFWRTYPYHKDSDAILNLGIE